MQNRVTNIAKAFDSPNGAGGAKSSRVLGLASKFNTPSSATSDSYLAGKVGDIASRFGKPYAQTSVATFSAKGAVKPPREILREKAGGQGREQDGISFEQASRRFREGPGAAGEKKKLEKKTSVHETARRFEQGLKAGNAVKKGVSTVADVSKKFSRAETSDGPLEENQSAFASASAAFKEREQSSFQQRDSSTVSRVASRLEEVSPTAKEKKATSQKEFSKATSGPPIPSSLPTKELEKTEVNELNGLKNFSSTVSDTASIFEKGIAEEKAQLSQDSQPPADPTAKEIFDSPSPEKPDENSNEARKGRFAEAVKAFSSE